LGQIKQLRKHFQADKQMEYQFDLQKKYGDRFILSVGPVVNLVIMDPDLISDILTKKSAHYTKPMLFRAQFGPVAGSVNLVIAEGETHAWIREMLNPAFHHVNLKSLVSIMAKETSFAIDGWINKNENKFFDLQIELHALSLAIVASSSFGMDTSGDLTTRICRLLQEGFDAVYYRTNHLPVFQIPILNQLPILKKQIIDKNAAALRSLVRDMITSRKLGKTKSNCDGSDLLDLLLTTEDEKGKKFSDVHVENETIAFVLAGHETTGTLLTWCIYILMTYPEVFNDCREEVDRVLCGETPTYDHMHDLHVIDAVVHETLRLYPPVSMVMRECISEHTIGEDRLQIPVGTSILFNFYNLHRSDKYWHDPLKFDYRRWMRNANGFKRKLAHPFCYLPFSAGVRNCIGQNFALLEAKILVAMIIQRLDLEIEPGQKIVPYQRITMKPKYGIKAKARRRVRLSSTLQSSN
jgi:cytochrome P450